MGILDSLIDLVAGASPAASSTHKASSSSPASSGPLACHADRATENMEKMNREIASQDSKTYRACPAGRIKPFATTSGTGDHGLVTPTCEAGGDTMCLGIANLSGKPLTLKQMLRIDHGGVGDAQGDLVKDKDVICGDIGAQLSMQWFSVPAGGNRMYAIVDMDEGKVYESGISATPDTKRVVTVTHAVGERINILSGADNSRVVLATTLAALTVLLIMFLIWTARRSRLYYRWYAAYQNPNNRCDKHWRDTCTFDYAWLYLICALLLTLGWAGALIMTVALTPIQSDDTGSTASWTKFFDNLNLKTAAQFQAREAKLNQIRLTTDPFLGLAKPSTALLISGIVAICVGVLILVVMGVMKKTKYAHKLPSGSTVRIVVISVGILVFAGVFLTTLGLLPNWGYKALFIVAGVLFGVAIAIQKFKPGLSHLAGVCAMIATVCLCGAGADALGLRSKALAPAVQTTFDLCMGRNGSGGGGWRWMPFVDVTDPVGNKIREWTCPHLGVGCGCSNEHDRAMTALYGSQNQAREDPKATSITNTTYDMVAASKLECDVAAPGSPSPDLSKCHCASCLTHKVNYKATSTTPAFSQYECRAFMDLSNMQGNGTSTGKIDC